MTLGLDGAYPNLYLRVRSEKLLRETSAFLREEPSHHTFARAYQMTDTCIIIPMLWAAIGLTTTHKATALADRFVTVGAVS